MIRFVVFILMGLIFLGAFPGDVLAQFGDQQQKMDRLEREIEITDEMLLQAEDFIRSTDNAIAAVSLMEAAKLQKGAREGYNQLRGRFQDNIYNLTLKATQRAREMARNAVATARQVQQYEGAVLRSIERSRDMLEQAREAVGETDNRGLRALYNQAENTLRRSWEFYRKQQYKPAYKLAIQVENAARKVMQAANADAAGQGTFQRRKEKVAGYLEQVRQQVSDCESEQAREMYQRAEQAFERAESNAEKMPGAALKQLQMAREMAAKAARECQGQENLQNQYRRLQGELERMQGQTDNLSGTDLDMVRNLLNQADRQLEKSRNFMDENSLEAAMVSLKAAQLALRKAGSVINK